MVTFSEEEQQPKVKEYDLINANINEILFDPTNPNVMTEEHPTAKPVEVLRQILDNTTDGSVYDPFLGSGSTLIACEQTGRRCYGIELDPHYVDVTVRRWEVYTGQKAKKVTS